MEDKITIELVLSRRQTRGLLTLSVLLAGSYALHSESLTVTSYYPSPSGIYRNLITRLETKFAQDSAGHVVIGEVSSPAQKLEVGGGIKATGSLYAAMGPRSVVGIGTATPAHKLDVQGEIGATALTVGAGSISGGSLSVSGSLSGASLSVSGALSGDTLQVRQICMGGQCRTTWPKGQRRYKAHHLCTNAGAITTDATCQTGWMQEDCSPGNLVNDHYIQHADECTCTARDRRDGWDKDQYQCRNTLIED